VVVVVADAGTAATANRAAAIRESFFMMGPWK